MRPLAVPLVVDAAQGGGHVPLRVEQLGALRVAVGGAIPTLRSLALRFVLEQAAVSSAILGPRNYAQLNQLVREAGRMPPYISPNTMNRLLNERYNNSAAFGSPTGRSYYAWMGYPGCDPAGENGFAP